MSAKIEFIPEKPVVTLNSPKGTKIATMKVTGMPEGVKPEIRLINNASERVEINSATGLDLLLTKDLSDDSDMTVQVEMPVENSFIDATLHLQVRAKNLVETQPEEVHSNATPKFSDKVVHKTEVSKVVNSKAKFATDYE